MKNKKTILFSFLVEKNGEGYLASVPSMRGAFAEGDTIEEAIFNCVEVLKMMVAYRRERGEPLGFDAVKLTKNTRMSIAVPVGVE